MREEVFALVVQNALNSTKQGTELYRLKAEVARLTKFEEGIKEIYKLNLGRHLDDLHEMSYVAYSDVVDVCNIVEGTMSFYKTTGGKENEQN